MVKKDRKVWQNGGKWCKIGYLCCAMEADQTKKSENTVEKSPKKRRVASRTRRIVWGILLGLLLLPVLLILLLYTPPVQRFALRKVLKEVSASTGMTIVAGDFRLAFPLRLRLQDVSAVNQKGDTVVGVGRLQTTLSPLSLLNQRVEAHRLELERVRVFMPDKDSTLVIAAAAEALSIGPLSVDLRKERVDAGSLRYADGYFKLYMRKKEQKEEKPVRWIIDANRIVLEHTLFDMAMPDDSLFVRADMQQANVEAFSINLEDTRVQSNRISVTSGETYYSTNLALEATDRVNYSDLHAETLSAEITDFVQQGSLLKGNIVSLAMQERSGACVKHFRGSLAMEDGLLGLDNFALQTDESSLSGSIRLPFALFRGDTTERAALLLRGSLSDSDIYRFSGQSVTDLLGSAAGTRPFELDIDAEGNKDLIAIRRLNVERQGVLKVDLRGKVTKVANPSLRNGEITLDALMQPAVSGIITRFASGMKGQLSIPRNTRLKLKAGIKGRHYTADTELSALGAGNAAINGRYSEVGQRYRARVKLHHFNVAAFMPRDSVGRVNADLTAQGVGFDFLSGRGNASVTGKIADARYKGNLVEAIELDGAVKGETVNLALKSGTPWAKADLLLNGTLHNGTMQGTLNGQIDTLSLAQLGVTQDTLSVGSDLHITFETDFKQRHAIEWQSDSLWYHMSGVPRRSFPLSLTAQLDTASSSATLSSGDLQLRADIEEKTDVLISKASEVARIASSLLSDTTGTNQMSLIARAMPLAELHFEMGRNNPAMPFLRDNRMYADRVRLDFVNHMHERMRLYASANNIYRDTTRIDSVGILLVSKEVGAHDPLSQSIRHAADYFVWTGTQPLQPAFEQVDSVTPVLLGLNASVVKNAYRGQKAFRIDAEATTDLNSIDLSAQYHSDGKLLHSLSALAFRNPNGFGLSFNPKPIVISGMELLPNEDNALFYVPKSQSIKANLQLSVDDGGSLLLTSEEGTDSGEDPLNLVVRRLQLGILEDVLHLEGLGGLAFADIRIERDNATKLPRVVGDLSINDFRYAHEPLGNVSMALFYEPHDKSLHYLTAHISHNGNLAVDVEGQYSTTDQKSPIKARAVVNDFPLELANPFIGANTATLNGMLGGEIKVSGTTKFLRLNGSLTPKQATVYLPQVGETFAIETEPLRFDDSKLYLKNFTLRDRDKDTPLYVNGDVTLFGPEAMRANIKVDGDEVELIDSKPGKGQLLYGKLIVSPHLTLRGAVSKPVIRGDFNILGGTDLTYVYSGSKLKATDNMAGVVVFTDFADTLFAADPAIALPTPGSADIALNIHIDPAVRLGVDLSPGHQDYVQVMGGGDLRFQSPPFGTMSLTGRYNLSGGGDVRYNFPVVGRKLFSIDPESYLSWSGKVDNPYINFKAVQRVRADVTEGGNTRKVDFDVLIVAKEDLSKIDLAFDLEAPDDLSLQNRLAAMSKEERGKQAVGLMVSGTFLASDPSEMSMQRILSGLAMSELNNLTGKFLEGTDLNVGMELHNSAGGSAYTDYTYSFSKRFFNNRVRFVIGGKVAAGNLPSNYEQTFIDNVTLEYRIDRAGNHYMSLFHKRNNDNLLEGLVTETGVSYILRRSLYSPGDLFRRSRKRIPTTPLDSLPTVAADTLKQTEVPQP